MTKWLKAFDWRKRKLIIRFLFSSYLDVCFFFFFFFWFFCYMILFGMMFSLFYFHSMSISADLLRVIVILCFIHHTNSLHCYKCDSTDLCRIQTNNLSRVAQYEIVQCEYFCWKSISLGSRSMKWKYFIDIFIFCFLFHHLGNVRRGCGRKRCDVSHTIGLFSTSVCCQTNFCNNSQQFSLSRYNILLLSIFIVVFYWKWI